MTSQLSEEEKACLRVIVDKHNKRQETIKKFKSSFIGALAVATAGGLVTALMWLGDKIIEIWPHAHH